MNHIIMIEDKQCKHVRKFITKDSNAPISGTYISKLICASWTGCTQIWTADEVRFVNTAHHHGVAATVMS